MSSLDPNSSEWPAQERSLQLLLEQTGSLVYRLDLDGRFQVVSRGALALTGYDEQELRTMALPELVAPEHALSARRLLSCLQEGSRLESLDCELVRKDGSRVKVLVEAVPEQRDGRAAGIFGIARRVGDIKTQIIAEAALALSAATGEQFFRSLVEQLADVLGADYTFVGELGPGKPEKIRTLAVFANGATAGNFEYDLAGTPCENVISKGMCAHPEGVQEMFPEDRLLAEMGGRRIRRSPPERSARTAARHHGGTPPPAHRQHRKRALHLTALRQPRCGGARAQAVG